MFKFDKTPTNAVRCAAIGGLRVALVRMPNGVQSLHWTRSSQEFRQWADQQYARAFSAWALNLSHRERVCWQKVLQETVAQTTACSRAEALWQQQLLQEALA